MLNTLPFILAAGAVLGFLSALGIGGGTLLILWLTLVLDISPETARGINLLFFVPCAVVACLFRFRQGSLNLRNILPALVAGAVSAALFSWIGSNIDTELLRKPFGILLLITGLKELFYRPRKAK